MRSILLRNRFFIAIVLLSTTFLLNGCPAVAVKRLVNKSQQSQAAYIQIYTADQTIPAYTKIGTITADNTTFIGSKISEQDIKADLKVKARKLGADAVIIESTDAKETTGLAVTLNP